MLSVTILGDGWCAWQFDAAVDDPGGCDGCLVDGADPVGVSFTPGESVVLCRYDPQPPEGAAWAFAGPDSEVTFADGLPGAAGSGHCAF